MVLYAFYNDLPSAFSGLGDRVGWKHREPSLFACLHAGELSFTDTALRFLCPRFASIIGFPLGCRQPSSIPLIGGSSLIRCNTLVSVLLLYHIAIFGYYWTCLISALIELSTSTAAQLRPYGLVLASANRRGYSYVRLLTPGCTPVLILDITLRYEPRKFFDSFQTKR